MALTTKKITLEAKSVVDNKEIMGFRAIIEPEKESEVSLLHYQIDKAACKKHRTIVREDQGAFEDYAFEMHEEMMAKING